MCGAGHRAATRKNPQLRVRHPNRVKSISDCSLGVREISCVSKDVQNVGRGRGAVREEEEQQEVEVKKKKEKKKKERK